MLSIEEVKQNLITSDIKLVSYSSTVYHIYIYMNDMLTIDIYIYQLLTPENKTRSLTEGVRQFNI